MPASTEPPQVHLTPQEILRQVSIAHKLGEIAEMYQFGEAEEEKWLTWAVEKLLGLLHAHKATSSRSFSGERMGEQAQEKPGEQVVLGDLDLPEWVTKTDIGAPLEALGAFYARHGNVESVFFLYLTSRSDTHNPFFFADTPCLSTSKPYLYSCQVHLRNLRLWKTAVEVCLLNSMCARSTSEVVTPLGAQIMNNLSSLIISKSPTPTTRAQAELWARKSAAVCGQEIGNAKLKKGEEDKLSVCESTLAVALFNMASLREVSVLYPPLCSG